MKVALVYDRLNKLGGAEQVLQCFHALYPDADWYTSVWDQKRTPFTKGWRIHTSFINKLPFLRHRHELVPFLMPFAFESFNLSGYDLVISIGSAECKGVITRPETLHLHYCLTPTRYLYSHAKQYLTNPLFRYIAKYLRLWDQLASTRPDVMISISQHVKNRVQKYYNRKSEVIYPPVDTKKFSSPVNSSSDYYLVVSRLVPYKNIYLIIRAFNQSGKKLVIVGEGSQYKRLRELARSNIVFTGKVNDKELISSYQNCRAFIQANIEDFGISMVEALASGKPVIAYNKGGAAEIVTNTNGVLYNELSESALNQAVRQFEGAKFTPSVIRSSAQQFDKTRWEKQIIERITQYVKHK